jgi:hypothetical protein
LLRYKLRAALKDVSLSVQTPLVSLCDRIATDPNRQDRRDQSNESDLRTSANRVGHISLGRTLEHAYWLDHIGDFGPP